MSNDWKAILQNVLVAAMNAGLAILVNKYGGPAAAAGTVLAGTAAAHAMRSPYTNQH